MQIGIFYVYMHEKRTIGGFQDIFSSTIDKNFFVGQRFDVEETSVIALNMTAAVSSTNSVDEIAPV